MAGDELADLIGMCRQAWGEANYDRRCLKPGCPGGVGWDSAASPRCPHCSRTGGAVPNPADDLAAGVRRLRAELAASLSAWEAAREQRDYAEREAARLRVELAPVAADREAVAEADRATITDLTRMNRDLAAGLAAERERAARLVEGLITCDVTQCRSLGFCEGYGCHTLARAAAAIRAGAGPGEAGG